MAWRRGATAALRELVVVGMPQVTGPPTEAGAATAGALA
jgi:hypothetical protein